MPNDLVETADRINEETSNNSSVVGSFEVDKEKSGAIKMLVRSQSQGKDLKKLEEETLAKGKI